MCGESRMKSCLWEHSKNTRQEFCGLGFFKTQNCSWNVFLCSSQVCQIAVSLLQINHYCLLLLFNYMFKLSIICLYGKTQRHKCFLPCAACPCDHMQLECMETLLMWFIVTPVAVGGWILHETLVHLIFRLCSPRSHCQSGKHIRNSTQ